MDLLSELFAPIQIPAWIAAVIYIVSYQRQSADKTILLWAPADFLMVVHFFYMGALFYLATAIGGIIRSLVAVYGSKKTLGYYLAFYLVVILSLFPFLMDGIKDYFAMVGTMCFCLSVWFKENYLLHRAFAFGHQANWIFAFFLLGSFGGLALIIFMFVSNVIGTGRYLLNKKSLS